ncbi:hypothetical protein BJ322DRAFT_1046218 [Thelephora terrestris]|uniref:Uncharacterized protein n=1 Tax=Thelephora terrestris TaxID=56493 RepID=A0A9P6HK18_9AGAM|nr:hypothetical protein BJ322DRAFT_1046218 [Thelephora terrestris]
MAGPLNKGRLLGNISALRGLDVLCHRHCLVLPGYRVCCLGFRFRMGRIRAWKKSDKRHITRYTGRVSDRHSYLTSVAAGCWVLGSMSMQQSKVLGEDWTRFVRTCRDCQCLLYGSVTASFPTHTKRSWVSIFVCSGLDTLASDWRLVNCGI